MWIEMFPAWYQSFALFSHPLCEDVDWNHKASIFVFRSSLPSSVRGCGLKLLSPVSISSADIVILCARMWIEISRAMPMYSLWSRHPLCEDVDWNFMTTFFSVTFPPVILRERMWIEMESKGGRSERKESHPPCEDVNWNRELHIPTADGA